jgi:hypothetical protein
MIEKNNICFEWVDTCNKEKSTIKTTLSNLLGVLWLKASEKGNTNPYAVKNPRFMPSRNIYQANNRIISEKEVDDYIKSI